MIKSKRVVFCVDSTCSQPLTDRGIFQSKHVTTPINEALFHISLLLFHFDSYFPDMGIASLVNSETCLSFLLMPHFSMYFRKTPQFLCISLQSVCCMLWLQEDSAEHTSCLCLTFSQNTLLGSSKEVTCLSSFINYFICIHFRTNTIRFFLQV